MRCNLCGEDISPDCFLTIGICVFCFYDTDGWDSHGQPVTRDQATLREVQGKEEPREVKPRVHLPKAFQRILPYALTHYTLAITRQSDVSAIDVDLLADVIAKCGFHVFRVDFAGVLERRDVALRLAQALGREDTDLKLVMRIYTDLQKANRICVIVENFEHALLLDRRKPRYTEETMRSSIEGHKNAAWLFFGTVDILDAFAIGSIQIWESSMLLIEELLTRWVKET